jgi:predicted KAP-like P-loop ATPase
MIKFQVFDAPINNPDDDLFGMASYAEKLSYFIDSVEPPFTIGIYGQWGDGKSSFVNLVTIIWASPPGRRR